MRVARCVVLLVAVGIAAPARGEEESDLLTANERARKEEYRAHWKESLEPAFEELKRRAQFVSHDPRPEDEARAKALIDIAIAEIQSAWKVRAQWVGRPDPRAFKQAVHAPGRALRFTAAEASKTVRLTERDFVQEYAWILTQRPADAEDLLPWIRRHRSIATPALGQAWTTWAYVSAYDARVTALEFLREVRALNFGAVRSRIDPEGVRDEESVRAEVQAVLAAQEAAAVERFVAALHAVHGKWHAARRRLDAALVDYVRDADPVLQAARTPGVLSWRWWTLAPRVRSEDRLRFNLVHHRPEAAVFGRLAPRIEEWKERGARVELDLFDPEVPPPDLPIDYSALPDPDTDPTLATDKRVYDAGEEIRIVLSGGVDRFPSSSSVETWRPEVHVVPVGTPDHRAPMTEAERNRIVGDGRFPVSDPKEAPEGTYHWIEGDRYRSLRPVAPDGEGAIVRFDRAVDGLPEGTYEARLVRYRYDANPAFEVEQRHVFVVGPVEQEYDFLLDKPVLRLLHAHHPDEPLAGNPVTLGLRLQNVPYAQARGVTLEILFIDGGTLEPVEGVEPQDERCRETSPGVFTCPLGDLDFGGHGDLAFRTILPRQGLRWLAAWDTGDGIGGRARARGEVLPVEKPRITDVFVLGDQDDESYGVPSYPYPYGPGRRGPETRTLFVIGRDLPARGDPFETTSRDEQVEYHFVSWPDSENTYHEELHARGWQRYRREVGLAADQPIPEGVDGLVVRATLRPGILPGDKELTLNDAAAVWSLRFGGLRATIDFVRDTDAPRVLRDAYLPDRVRVRVRTSRELPLDEIPVMLFERDRRGNLKPHRTTARRDPEGPDPRTWFTPPIDLVERMRPHMALPPPDAADALRIDVDYGSGTPTSLLAEVEEGFRSLRFHMPCDPQVASVSIRRGPADGEPSWLFKRALARAARCHDLPVHDWDALTDEEAETFTNLIVLTLEKEHLRRTEVKLGHHAAMLLMRDLFATMLKAQLPRIQEILRDERQVLGFLNYMSENWNDERFPVNLVEVADPNGGTTTFGSAVTFDDVPFLAAEYGRTPEEIERWRLAATREALETLHTQTGELHEEIIAIDDDDVEDLLEMTGRGFGAVIEELIPRLMALREESVGGRRYLFWTPDLDAQLWVGQVAAVAEALRKQRFDANLDTQTLLAATALLTMPLMLAEGTGVVLFCFAVDLLDFGVTAAIELSQYHASQEELRFSRRAMLVLGPQRHERAKAEAKGWASTLLNVGVSGFFVGLSASEVLRLARSAGWIAKGRMIARSLKARGFETLSELERRYFGAFSIRSRVRLAEVGFENLTDVERRALSAVEEQAAYAVGSTRTAATPPGETRTTASARNDPDTIAFRHDFETARIEIAPAEPAVRPRGREVETRSASTRGETAATKPDAPPAGSVAAPGTRTRADTTPSARLVDLCAGTVPGSPSARRAVHNLPVDEVGAYAEGSLIAFRTEQGDWVRFRLGRYVDSGSFTVVFGLPGGSLLTKRRVVKFTFDTVVEADEFGYRALRQVDSDHVRAAERVASFRVASSGQGGEVLFVQVVEELPPTADRMMEALGRRLNDAELAAIDGALRDLNAKGYAWLDMKTDNFGFQVVDGRTRVVIHDTGGIVRVSSPERARELQLHVNAPFSRRFPDATRYRGHRVQRAHRARQIEEEFLGDVTPAANEGRSIFDVEFNPAGGDQLRELGRRFAAD